MVDFDADSMTFEDFLEWSSCKPLGQCINLCWSTLTEAYGKRQQGQEHQWELPVERHRRLERCLRPGSENNLRHVVIHGPHDHGHLHSHGPCFVEYWLVFSPMVLQLFLFMVGISRHVWWFDNIYQPLTIMFRMLMWSSSSAASSTQIIKHESWIVVIKRNPPFSAVSQHCDQVNVKFVEFKHHLHDKIHQRVWQMLAMINHYIGHF